MATKEGVPVWSCKQTGGCIGVMVTCNLNAKERKLHCGFYGISVLRYNAAKCKLEQRLMLKDAIYSLRKGLNHALAKERNKCTT